MAIDRKYDGARAAGATVGLLGAVATVAGSAVLREYNPQVYAEYDATLALTTVGLLIVSVFLVPPTRRA